MGSMLPRPSWKAAALVAGVLAGLFVFVRVLDRAKSHSTDMPVDAESSFEASEHQGPVPVSVASLTPQPLETRVAILYNSQATIDAWTPIATKDPVDLLATAEAAFDASTRPSDAFRYAVDVVQLSDDPVQRSYYEDYIRGLAEQVVASELPFPYEEHMRDVPEPSTDAKDGETEACRRYTQEFIQACEASNPIWPDADLCAHYAVTMAPRYMRALLFVPESQAVPVALEAVDHANVIVSQAAIAVLCAFQARQHFSTLAARTEELRQSEQLQSYGMVQAIAGCDDPGLEALALQLLEGDHRAYDALKAGALTLPESGQSPLARP